MKVGDEFWDDWHWDKSSTDTQEHRIKYRVVEMVKIHEHGLWGKLIDAPRLEPLEIESRAHNVLIEESEHE